jgi:hypothetical protein
MEMVEDMMILMLRGDWLVLFGGVAFSLYSARQTTPGI